MRVTHCIVGEKPVLIGALQHICRPRICTFRRSHFAHRFAGHLQRGCRLHAISAPSPQQPKEQGGGCKQAKKAA